MCKSSHMKRRGAHLVKAVRWRRGVRSFSHSQLVRSDFVRVYGVSKLAHGAASLCWKRYPFGRSDEIGSLR